MHPGQLLCLDGHSLQHIALDRVVRPQRFREVGAGSIERRLARLAYRALEAISWTGWIGQDSCAAAIPLDRHDIKSISARRTAIAPMDSSGLRSTLISATQSLILRAIDRRMDRSASPVDAKCFNEAIWRPLFASCASR